MPRIRLFTLLTVSFLLASAALADDLAYVDCASHPENTQVFSKARQTPDSLGTIACGERFTVLVYGFVFSRVQTKDGKVGYIYSNLLTVDRGAPAPAVPNAPAAVPVKPVVANASVNAPAYAQPASAAQAASMPVTTSPAAEKLASQSSPLFPTPPMPAVTAADWASRSAKSASASSASAQPAPAANAPAPPASSPAPAVNIQPVPPEASQPVAPAAVEPSSAAKSASAPSSAPAPVTPSVSSSTPASAPAASTPAPSQPSAPAPAETQAAAASSTPAQSSAPARPGPLFPTPPPPPSASDPSSSAASSAAAEPAPAPAAASQPQPEASQPTPEPVRDASARSSWEQPTAVVRQNFLVQLYGGYAFDRFTSGGAATNLSGGMGSFGYNVKPWLQIVADTSYSYVTGTGVKNVLYGNHFGARYFYHPGRWRVTPFAEALVGGSRYDITVSGPGGYRTSQNCISYKAGGGLDFRVSRRWEVRVIDVDYYRTSFGAGSYLSQNNYWASAGVVMRLFGSGASQ